MTIEEAAKQLKSGSSDRNNYGQQLGSGHSQMVSISKAINGFVIMLGGNTMLCADIAQLQAALEEYFEEIK